MIKKLVSILLIMIMMMSVFAIVPISAEAKILETTVVYFSPTSWYNNRNWNRYFIYFSDSEIDTSQLDGNSWPGEEMEYVGTDANGKALFKYELPRVYNHVVFNNGVKKNLSVMSMTTQCETTDIEIPKNTKAVTYYLDDFDLTGLFTYVFTTKRMNIDYYEEYFFTTGCIPELSVPTGCQTQIAVSKTEGNIEGDPYSSGDHIGWYSDDPDVLRVNYQNEHRSIVYVEGLKYGTTTLHFTINGEDIASEEITVLVPIEELIQKYGYQLTDNATLTTLKNAIKIPRNILDNYGAGDYLKVALFTMLGDDLGITTAVKEYQHVIGARTRAEEAMYQSTIDMLNEYFEVDNSLSDQISSFMDIWGCSKQVISAVKGAKDDKAIRKILKKKLPELFDIPIEKVDSLLNGMSLAAKGISEIATIAELAVTAATLAKYEKGLIKNLLGSVPKSSYAYKGLNLVYNDMKKDFVQYVIDTYCTEKLVGKISSLAGDLLISYSKTLIIAKNVGNILSFIYTSKGGATIEDFYKCLYSHRIAKDLYQSLSSQGTAAKLQSVFDLCVAAAKTTLNNGIKIAGSDSYSVSQKQLANEYLKKLDGINYSMYIRDSQKEMFEMLEKEEVVFTETEGKVKSYIRQKISDIAPTGSDEIADYLSDDNTDVLVIPAMINEELIEGVDADGFAGAEYNTIILPDSITDIRDGAFKECKTTAVLTGEKIAYIGNESFKDCSELQDIILPSSVRTIGTDAFAGCTSLSTLTLGASVESVGSKAFSGCTALENIFFKNPDVEISEDALDGCADTLVVYGYGGTDAEIIANKKGFEFIDLGRCLRDLAIETPAEQTVFEYDTPVSLDGLTLRATYCDGTQEIVEDGFAIAYDSAKIGSQDAVLRFLNLELSYPIEITDVAATDIDTSQYIIQMMPGNAMELNINILPENATNGAYEISSSDTSIAYENNGTVYVNDFGYAELTVTTTDGSLTRKIPVYGVNYADFLLSDSGDTDITFFKAPYSGSYDLMINGSDDAVIRLLDKEHSEMAVSSGKNLSFDLIKGEIYTIEAETAKEDEDRFKVYFYCSDLNGGDDAYITAENEDGTVTLINYLGTEENLIVPDTVDGKRVSSISYAFKNNEILKTVVIPGSVTSVDNDAFYGCKNLKKVVVEDGVKHLGRGAFALCASLTHVEIPESVETVWEYAFLDCPLLKNVAIPNASTFLGYMCVGYYEAVTEEGGAEIVKMDDFTIYGIPGSTSEEYAERFGFTFVDINDIPTDHLLGDIDCDTRITAADATLIQRYTVQIDIPITLNEAVADTDGDGQVTLMDASYIQRWLARLPSNDEIGKAL